MSSLISIGYNKTTNKVEMTIVGDEEVTFGDDLCGALGLAHGAHAQRQITSLTVQHVLWAELPVCVHKPGQGRMVGESQTPLLRAIPVYGN